MEVEVELVDIIINRRLLPDLNVLSEAATTAEAKAEAGVRLDWLTKAGWSMVAEIDNSGGQQRKNSSSSLFVDFFRSEFFDWSQKTIKDDKRTSTTTLTTATTTTTTTTTIPYEGWRLQSQERPQECEAFKQDIFFPF